MSIEKNTQSVIIDGLQYNNWDRALFEKTRDSGLNAVHVTITYWEDFRALVRNISEWHRQFEQHSDLILQVRSADDILLAKEQNKLGILFGLQNCSPVEDDLALVQIIHELGVRIMQLSYNNQSLLAAGCYEDNDSGITRFGKQVIKEMNRVGMLIDMSHSGEKSTLEAVDLSDRPIAITHANPSSFHPALRNKSEAVIRALAESGGMLGFSLYPFHLKDGSNCKLEDFCQAIADTVDIMGVDQVAIGSDLCEQWSYKTLEWMRSGTWTFKADYGEGSANNLAWPKQPSWFEGSQHIMNIAQGLTDVGFDQASVDKVMGNNWLQFFRDSFAPRWK